MKRRFIVTLLLSLGFVIPLHAVGNTYETGKILEIQEKARTRVLYYLVNTPVTQDDPYYEVSVQIKNTTYTAEYTPRHSADALPEEWKPQTTVQARVEKHHLFLKRPSDSDLQLVIVKRIVSEPAQKAPDPEPAGK